MRWRARNWALTRRNWGARRGPRPARRLSCLRAVRWCRWAPFLYLTGMSAVMVSLLVSALALFLVGAAITLFTGRSVLATGLRQLLFGAVAAGVTYGIGRLLGITLAV